MTSDIEFTIECGEVTAFEADILALKYAQGFHGVDRSVATILDRGGIPLDSLRPNSNAFRFVRTKGLIRAEHVLLVGGVRIFNFDYEQIRELGARVLAILSEEAPETRHLAMTFHGVGYGLDELEAARAQFQGY